MTPMSPELVGLFAATTGVGYLMMTAGRPEVAARMARTPAELPRRAAATSRAASAAPAPAAPSGA